MKSKVQPIILRLAFLGAFCAMGHAATPGDNAASAAPRSHSGWMLVLGLTALGLPAKRRRNG